MQLDTALEFIQEKGVSLVSDQNLGLLGLAVGRKNEGPVIGERAALEGFCITAFVPKKLPDPQLRHRGLADAVETLFQALQSKMPASAPVRQHDIDVVEVGDKFRALSFPYMGSHHANPASSNTQKWFESLRPGIGIANPTDSYPGALDAGTLGFFVQDGTDIYLVSTNHVIARENTAAPSEWIVQPATLDMSGSDISRLPDITHLVQEFGVAQFTTFVPVQLHASSNIPVNKVDAALARVMARNRDLANLGRLPYGSRIQGVAPPYNIDSRTGSIVGSGTVYKVGRSSGYTEGVVTGLYGVVEVEFENGKATFVDQIIVSPTADNTGPFADVCDSGSALLNEYNQVVGLIFAGGPRRSLANPVVDVLTELSRAAGTTSLSIVI